MARPYNPGTYRPRKITRELPQNPWETDETREGDDEISRERYVFGRPPTGTRPVIPQVGWIQRNVPFMFREKSIDVYGPVTMDDALLECANEGEVVVYLVRAGRPPRPPTTSTSTSTPFDTSHDPDHDEEPPEFPLVGDSLGHFWVAGLVGGRGRRGALAFLTPRHE